MLHETQFPSKSEYEAYLRDYFAAAALQGICSTLVGDGEPRPVLIAVDAYRFADAMIAEREKRDAKD